MRAESRPTISVVTNKSGKLALAILVAAISMGVSILAGFPMLSQPIPSERSKSNSVRQPSRDEAAYCRQLKSRLRSPKSAASKWEKTMRAQHPMPNSPTSIHFSISSNDWQTRVVCRCASSPVSDKSILGNNWRTKRTAPNAASISSQSTVAKVEREQHR